MSDPIAAYAKLNARVMPEERGLRFEDPLIEALAENQWAEVTGGGTMQAENGEIDYCGIDIDFHDLEQGIAFVCATLDTLGAPKGSVLQFEKDGEQMELEFGFLEGVGVYFNGTDLPDEVYENYDINDVAEELNNLCEERAEIMGYWEGPEETALYIYGYSAEEIQSLIGDLLATNPLCAGARVEVIA